MVNNPHNSHYNHHHHHHKAHDQHHKMGKFEEQGQGLVVIVKREKAKLFSLLCLCFLSCTLIWVPLILGFPSPLSFILCGDSSTEAENFVHQEMDSDSPTPSLAPNGTIYCDRSHFRTDICFMKGDIRTHSRNFSIFSYTPTNSDPNREDSQQLVLQHETIKPYTRKWETSVMNTIDQLHLISKPKSPSSDNNSGIIPKCDVEHDVPAIFFSTGGYTGNVYHEFNDGIIPLYITSQRYNRKVVFVILEYHDWWYTKYAPVLSQLSDYPPVDFNSDRRTHCFPEATVGLRIHDELTVDPAQTENNKSILHFRNLLGQAFEPPTPTTSLPANKKPKLVILSRKGSRSITNEHALIKLAQRVGFHVHVLKPTRSTELGSIYKTLSDSDVMVGVHGAAMTHLLFLRHGSVLVQVIPLGTDWASETYYGEPAKKLGLRYVGYKIDPRESSLYSKYEKNDPVLRDPESVNKRGWEFTKRVYLGDQNVTLDLRRFKRVLVEAYQGCRRPGNPRITARLS